MGLGSTLITHDSDDSIIVDHCSDPGCYSRPINYNATMKQMMALTQISTHCQQFFQYQCQTASFEYKDVQYAWWNDRSGNKQYYWAGNNSNIHTCQCGIDNNCIDVLARCNCDSLTAEKTEDQGATHIICEKNKNMILINMIIDFITGYLTNADALPVTALNFGRTSSHLTLATHSLGPLECFGQVKTVGMPSSCEDLWRSGQVSSGFYTVKGSTNLVNVFCDFEQLPGQPGKILS